MVNKISQREKVLRYMQRKGYITTRDAGINLNVWDLQSNIRDLKNEGIVIYSEYVTNKNTKSTYKVYALNKVRIENYKKRYA